MIETFWGTTNLKVAAAVATYGAVLRPVDPVTCIVKDGQRQFTFWFNDSGTGNAKDEMECGWAQMQSEPEAAVRYIRAALENRETLLGLMKRAEPITAIKRGEQTLLVSERAKPDLKRALLNKM